MNRYPLTEGLSKEEILYAIERNLDNNDIDAAKAIKEELYERQDPIGDKVNRNTDITECLRWAERALAILVRRGQEGPNRYIAGEWSRHIRNRELVRKMPLDYFASARERTCAVVFGQVNDAEFSNVIARCKANGSMARDYVHDSLRGIPRKRVLHQGPGTSNSTRYRRAEPRPKVLQGKTHVDATRVLRESVNAMISVFIGINQILNYNHYRSLDPEEARQWDNELADITGEIRRLRRRIQEGQK